MEQGAERLILLSKRTAVMSIRILYTLDHIRCYGVVDHLSRTINDIN